MQPVTDHPARLVAIFIAPASKAPMRRVPAVRALAGRGLEGDRYFFGRGAFSRWPGPHREVTLIAEEALAEMAEAAGVQLAPEQTRRNLLVRGVPLGDLKGVSFRIGDVQLRGERLCQPCRYLARLTDTPGLVRAMLNRGGLRARLLSDGTLREGDAVSMGDLG